MHVEYLSSTEGGVATADRSEVGNTERENNQTQKSDGADPEQVDNDSDEESSDVESMLNEIDPVKRHLKKLKIKQKEIEKQRRKVKLPRFSTEARGWNAPQDQPYVPVGRMTELVSAVK